MNNNPNFHAFTLSFNGRSQRLISPIMISSAYKFANPPNPIPPQTQANALWDTGASCSFITKRLADKLGLISVSVGQVNHAGGTDTSNKYIVNLVLPNQVQFEGLFVNECKMDDAIDLIIGMEVITLGDFALTNVGGKTLFSFRIPSKESVDFVKQHYQQVYGKTNPNAPCPCGSGTKFKKCHQSSLR